MALRNEEAKGPYSPLGKMSRDLKIVVIPELDEMFPGQMLMMPSADIEDAWLTAWIEWRARELQ